MDGSEECVSCMYVYTYPNYVCRVFLAKQPSFVKQESSYEKVVVSVGGAMGLNGNGADKLPDLGALNHALSALQVR